MAEGTYEYECMRAELLGIEKPDQNEFEKQRAERLKQEEEEIAAAEATLLEEQEQSLNAAGGKLDELNSILSSTQQKLNRFKQTACGSLSNMFSRGASVDVAASNNESPSTSATASRRNTTASGGMMDMAAVTDDNGDMQEKKNSDGDVQPMIPTEKIRAAKLDIQKKMTSHLSKLDSLLSKAENAEVSMSEQTKQMRKMAD